jgi:integrase
MLNRTYEMTAKTTNPPENAWPKVRQRTVKYKGKGDSESAPREYTVFTVDLGVVDGKRKTKTFKTLDEAEKFAEGARKRRRRLGVMAFQLDGRQLVDATEALEILDKSMSLSDAARISCSLSESQMNDAVAASAALEGRPLLTDAVAFYLKHHDLGGSSPGLKEVVTEYLDDAKEANLRPKSLQDLRLRLEKFTSAFPNRTICEITSPEVETWLKGLKKPDGTPLSQLSKKHYRTVVGGLFNFALDHGHASQNPLRSKTNRRRHRSPLTDSSLPSILPNEVVSRIMETAQDHAPCMVPALAVAFFAGLRTTEVRQLLWTHIDVRERLITVPPEIAKIRSVRHVPMEDNLIQWLTTYEETNGPIAPQETAWRYHFDKVRNLAKIKEWPANAMRHCFASNHLALHQNQNLTALALGHRDTNLLYNHYRGLVKPNQAKKFFSICPQTKLLVLADTNRVPNCQS